MRVPNHTHRDRPWRIHDIVPDFTLEDVWTQPEIAGAAADFRRSIALFTDSDPAHASNLPTRVLWQVRDVLGRVFSLGSISDAADDDPEPLPIPGTSETSLVWRLPEDLVGTADDIAFDHLPFVPLYRTDDEFAAEISNRTVHAVMHLGWVNQGGDRYCGEMAVYVKPRGAFGSAYMAFIRPFRHVVVYPALERQLARSWRARKADPSPL